ncbi:family 3 glycoside hydrolase [Xylariomycetidae sp. FL0641]|nr:family 3 glycoside hydrolase [Xylariomycetidae sp. FL0641]
MTRVTDLEAVLKSLTLEEKASMLAGANFWETVPIPAKGVPNIKTSDGPNGARGADFSGGTRAACFPAACCVAATFDPEAANRVGQALAEECHTKGARCLLAPTTCIHRHPLGGRNFESFSEDPFLAGKLASQVIQGCQSRGVAATIKHFAANEQETDRFTVDETVSERALREIYMRPFEIAIKESKPWAVMTAYNSVNGQHCDSNQFMLQQVLRGEWGWKGLIMSDWGGTNSTAEAINAGLDLEMPGPALRRKVPDVVAAVKEGKVSESTINDRVRAVLWLLEKLKAFEDPVIPPEQAINKPEHQKLIRETGAHGAVLLKNDNSILPLSKEKVKGKKIALVGLAKEPLAHGGGSASVNAHYKIAPFDALQTVLGDSAELVYAKGCHTLRLLPSIHSEDKAIGNVIGLNGKPGFTMEWFNKDTNELKKTEHGKEVCHLSPILTKEGKWSIVEYTGDFTPKESGSHYMGCSGLGPTQFFINDKLVFEQKGACSDAMGFLFGALSEEEFTYPYEAGKTYRLKVRSHPPVDVPGLELLNGRTGLRLGLQLAAEHDADLLGEATAIAKECDYAVVFTGHTPAWETEGQDQPSFHLPNKGSQDTLVNAVASVNKNVIVVNSTGVAVAMPWLDNISGLVQSWFPGQECGNSIADVLTGAVNPEGRMPCSFPKRLEDAPAHGNFPGDYENGQLKVEYKEGVFVGYRHYDRTGRDKLNFPFGYGLSYTTFEQSNMKVTKKSSDTYTVSVDVTNTGKVPGGDLVQIYVGAADKPAEHPIKSLVAFQKVRLGPGEKKTVELPIALRDAAHYDEKAGKWIVARGQHEFMLGWSAADIMHTEPITVEEEIQYAP